MRCLIADDEQDIADIVAFGVRMTWPNCEIDIASSGKEALERFSDSPPDLVILDVSMPPPDGFDICRRIREQSQVPILMLTVHRNTLDKIRALDYGADDYLTKPFDHLELLARLRALVRRSQAHEPTSEPDFVSGNLSIDFTTHEVRLNDQVVRLTQTEYRVLEALVKHAGTVMPHQLLLDRVWGPDWIGDPGYIKVYIRRLRQKLGDDADSPRFIQTEWGLGYRFVAAHQPAPIPPSEPRELSSTS